MTTRQLNLPFIPNPPSTYDPVYTQQSIRTLTTYLRNMQTPGDARHTQIVLTNATVDYTLVEANSIMIDPPTGYLVLNPLGATVVASGGTEATYTSGTTNYKSHTFLSDGSFVLSSIARVEVLIVAGGGSGGRSAEAGGGGGAGGVIVLSSFNLPPGTYPVVVGAGAVIPIGNAVGNRGGDSSVFGVEASGGGGGGQQESINASTGGSGGGGGGRDTGGTSSGASAVTYDLPYPFRIAQGYVTRAVSDANISGLQQGNNGGTTLATIGDIGSGGGGAGAVGGSATVNSGPAGNGGVGIQNAFRTGSNVYYGGGGGGGTQIAGSGGLGGQGGGGRGANFATATSAVAGTANTGGGGGGGETATYVPGAGGSGIVVIRYVT